MSRKGSVAASARIALAVGTILVAINWGSAILRGTFASRDWWRLLLNFVTPFLVAEYARRRLSGATSPKDD